MTHLTMSLLMTDEKFDDVDDDFDEDFDKKFVDDFDKDWYDRMALIFLDLTKLLLLWS